MAQSLSKCFCTLVFSTKNRDPWINPMERIADMKHSGTIVQAGLAVLVPLFVAGCASAPHQAPPPRTAPPVEQRV